MNYAEYAEIYDGSGQIRFALLTALYLEDILASHPVVGRQLLDVACGTGTLALLLAERGWQVCGIDASAEMLAQARGKSLAEGVEARWLLGDMRRLAEVVEAERFDLITCTYDSVNYLLSADEVTQFLHGVYHALRPGGLAYFDLNTEWFLANDWGECAVHEQAGLVQIEQSSYDPIGRISTLLLTAFVGDDASGWRRIDEAHLERAYPTECVTAAVQQAGLQLEAIYDGFTRQPVQPASQRQCWVVRRPAERE